MEYSLMVHLHNTNSNIAWPEPKYIENFVQNLTLRERWTNSFLVKLSIVLYSKVSYSVHSMVKYKKYAIYKVKM